MTLTPDSGKMSTFWY